MFKKTDLMLYFITALIIIGSFILKGLGIDGTVDIILIAMVSFVTGLNLPKPKD